MKEHIDFIYPFRNSLHRMHTTTRVHSFPLSLPSRLCLFVVSISCRHEFISMFVIAA